MARRFALTVATLAMAAIAGSLSVVRAEDVKEIVFDGERNSLAVSVKPGATLHVRLPARAWGGCFLGR